MVLILEKYKANNIEKGCRSFRKSHLAVERLCRLLLSGTFFIPLPITSVNFLLPVSGAFSSVSAVSFTNIVTYLYRKYYSQRKSRILLSLKHGKFYISQKKCIIKVIPNESIHSNKGKRLNYFCHMPMNSGIKKNIPEIKK